MPDDTKPPKRVNPNTDWEAHPRKHPSCVPIASVMPLKVHGWARFTAAGAKCMAMNARRIVRVALIPHAFADTDPARCSALRVPMWAAVVLGAYPGPRAGKQHAAVIQAMREAREWTDDERVALVTTWRIGGHDAVRAMIAQRLTARLFAERTTSPA